MVGMGMAIRFVITFVPLEKFQASIQEQIFKNNQKYQNKWPKLFSPKVRA